MQTSDAEYTYIQNRLKADLQDVLLSTKRRYIIVRNIYGAPNDKTYEGVLWDKAGIRKRRKDIYTVRKCALEIATLLSRHCRFGFRVVAISD